MRSDNTLLQPPAPLSIYTSALGWPLHIDRLTERRSMHPECQHAGLSEDGVVSPSAENCDVCHRLRSSGSRNHDGDIFICAQCEANADQLFEIQDAIWSPTVAAGEPTDEAATPTQP